MENKTVYLELDGGLGDRIRNLLGTIKFYPGHVIKILWHRNNHLNCDFHKLFKNREFEILEPKDKPSVFRRPHEAPDDRPVFVLYEMQRPLELTDVGNMVIPQDSIREVADEFSTKYKLQDRIGLHIRRGDLLEQRIYREGAFHNQRCIRTDQFVKIYQDNPNELFFLSSEDLEIQKLFGDRMVRFNHGGATREKEEDILNAYVDIILLSKVKKIYGGWSAFSVVSQAMGKNELEILYNMEEDYWKNTVEAPSVNI